jgi:hypothetical protein
MAPSKVYESPIAEITKHTFNTGENKFAAQFTEYRERVAGYIQRAGMEESYLVAETIRTAKAQTIALPPPVDGIQFCCSAGSLFCYLFCKVWLFSARQNTERII